jgi:hypothetical protein
MSAYQELCTRLRRYKEQNPLVLEAARKGDILAIVQPRVGEAEYYVNAKLLGPPNVSTKEAQGAAEALALLTAELGAGPRRFAVPDVIERSDVSKYDDGPPRAPLKPGSALRTGTLGWCVWLEGHEDPCGLTNWHVIPSGQDELDAGMGNRMRVVERFAPDRAGGPTSWDAAVVEFFRYHSIASVWNSYPMSFSTDVTFDRPYSKDGAATEGRGSFWGVADVWVDFGTQRVPFVEQLCFVGDGEAAFSQPKDSGSIVVAADGTVTGLHFFGFEPYHEEKGNGRLKLVAAPKISLSNPIFLWGRERWQTLEPKPVPGSNLVLPRFRVLPNVVPPKSVVPEPRYKIQPRPTPDDDGPPPGSSRDG